MTADVETGLARRMWAAMEPYHALVYFAPETRDVYGGAGLRGYWMGYFATRAAPMGPVAAEVVTATFYNFAPAMVARAVPDAWSFAPVERIRAARLEVADTALTRVLGSRLDGPGTAEAVALAGGAVEACTLEGRPLFAGHASLPWPAEPHLALWHGATLLREYRGDGHVAALLGHGVGGCEAHVLRVGAGTLPRDLIQPVRGWSDDQWSSAEEGLRSRGLVDGAGDITGAGSDLLDRIDVATDELAAAPWHRLGAARSARLAALVGPLSRVIVDAGEFPVPNPVGAPAPGA